MRCIGLLPAILLLSAGSLAALHWSPSDPPQRFSQVSGQVSPGVPNLFSGNPTSPFGNGAHPAMPSPAHPGTTAPGQPGAPTAPPTAGLIPPRGGLPPAPIIGTTPGGPPTGVPGMPAPNLPASGANDPAAPIFNKAVEAQRAGRMAEAIKGYQDVIKLSPRALPAYTNLAIIYLQTKQTKQALASLREAQKLDPKNPGLTAQIAQTLAADSQFEASYAEWVKLATAMPNEGEAAFAAGSLALQNLKRPAEAEKWLRTAAQLSKRDPRPALLLGQLLLQSQRGKEAESVLTAGTARFPDVVDLWSMLADARLTRGDSGGAIQALLEGKRRLPKQLVNSPFDARLNFALGRAYAANGKWKEAAEAATVATKLMPKEPDAYGLLGEALLRTGDRTGGAAKLRKVLELDPKRHGARVVLARVLTDLDRLDEAQAQYTAYLKVRSDDGQALMESAELYEKQKQDASALNLWTRAVKSMPDNPLPALRKAQTLKRLDRDSDALEAFRYVLQIKPAEPTSLAGAAEIEEKQGDTMRALAHLKALVEAGARDSKTYESLLRVAARKEQVPATLNFLELQLAKNPDRPGAYEAILEHHLRMGQPAEGRQIVQDMIRRFPKTQAPRLALAAFDREHPIKAAAKPTPSSTEPKTEPTKTPTPQNSPSPKPASTTPDEQPVTTQPAATAPEMADNTPDGPKLSLSPSTGASRLARPTATVTTP